MSSKQITGTRAQVMHGTANKTSGGLTKSQLKYNKQGKIVSRKASALATKNNRLVKAGYVTTKGVFGIVKTRGGNRFLLGNPPQSHFRKTRHQTINPDLSLCITPIPIKVATFKDFGLEQGTDYSEGHRKFPCRVSHIGVVKVLKFIYGVYFKRINNPKTKKSTLTGIVLPTEDQLNKMSTRHLVMYMGQTEYTFNMVLEKINQHYKHIFEKTRLVDTISVNDNIKRYKDLASENFETYFKNGLKGMKITTNNYKEQTLWRFALYYVDKTNKIKRIVS